MLLIFMSSYAYGDTPFNISSGKTQSAKQTEPKQVISPPPPVLAQDADKGVTPEIIGKVNTTVVITEGRNKFFVKDGGTFRGCAVKYPHLECFTLTSPLDVTDSKIKEIEKKMNHLKKQIQEIKRDEK